MNPPTHQPIRMDDKYVFLVLTEQTGSDFTFYLRNEEAKLVRQILQDESGEEREFSYSCRIHILRPLLNKKDLKKAGKQTILLRNLRKAMNAAMNARKPEFPYDLLIKKTAEDLQSLGPRQT